jgi:two-component system CheB/CheR fusion protein
MPESAIRADIVDLVLAPEAIGADLAALATGMPLPSERELEEGLEEGDPFHEIPRLLKDRTGVDVSRYKPTTLRRRVARRMSLVRAESLADYASRLREDAAELSALHEDLFIHVTSFSRPPPTRSQSTATRPGSSRWSGTSCRTPTSSPTAAEASRSRWHAWTPRRSCG